MTKTSLFNAQALKAVGLFASSEETRYYLNGVLLTLTARAALYVATDGHRMLVHRDELPEEAVSNELLGRWIIPSAAIKQLKPARNIALTPISETADGELILDTLDAKIIAKPIDGTFPDFHRVIPCALDPKEPVGRPQFNGDYVASFTKAAKLLECGAPHFHYGDPRNPCAVTFAHHGQTFGVLMPLRNEAPLWGGAPVWLSEKAPDPVAIAAE